MSVTSSPSTVTTSSTDISTQICQALAVTQPDLDTSIGTPVRKMIDAISVSIASAYIDQYFISNQYDVTSLTGTALDDFVNIFGMTRFPASRATGVVTFSRPTSATTPVNVLSGTAVATNDSPPIIFTTVTTGVMPIGSVSIDVPVIAQIGGSNGNVPAGAIANFQTQVAGISNITNLVGTSGGSNAESDEALITRFQNTVFRNLAGTESQFLGTALENTNCTAANVVGSYKTHREQIQMVGGIAQSEIQSAKYVFTQNFVFGPDIDGGDILNPGVNYTFSATTPALPSLNSGPVSGNLTVTPTALSGGQSIGAHGNRSYKIAFANEIGVTLPSDSILSTTGTTQYNLLTWVAPINALYTYIYENATAGFETLIAIVPAELETFADYAHGSTSISGVSTANPSVISTSGNHGLATGQQVTISGVLGATQANGNWVITVLSNTTFSITANVIGTYTSGGVATPTDQGLAVSSTNTTGVAPTVTSIDSVNCPDGIYDFEFNYTPQKSRNDPGNLSGNGAVLNKVDIFVAGQDIENATDVVVWNNPPTFNNTVGDPYYYKNYSRPDGSHPVVGNYLLDLTFPPVTNIPNEITLSGLGGTPMTGSGYQTIGNKIIATDSGTSEEVGAQSYTLGTDYYLINDITAYGGTSQSNSGIEFSQLSQAPPTNSLMSVSYNYNALPADIQSALEQWRIITSDVWVHQAIQKYLTINLVVILNSNTSSNSVTTNVTSAIQNIFSALNFDSILSTSAILTAVGNVPGITAVRFATSADNANTYAIQEFSAAGALVRTYAYNSGGTSRAIDVYLDDDTIPVFNGVNITVTAGNTFQTGA